MPEKRGEKNLCGENAFGIAGFILGILSIIYIGWAGILIALVGFFLSLYQQKKNPTKAGRIGLVLNIIGFVAGIIVVAVYAYILLPKLQEFLGTQSFPIA